MSHNESEYSPDYSIHPGHFVEEELSIQGLKQTELAKRTGLTNKTINAIIKGNASISPDTAIVFEVVLGKPASYWLNLDNAYQIQKAHKTQNDILKQDIDFLKKIDVKSLINNKWINKYDDKVQQLKELLSFFGVASKKQLDSVWSTLEIKYRTTEAYSKSQYNIMAWLRYGELLAQKIECNSYSSKKFKLALTECRKLTNLSFPDVKDKIQTLCANAGVAVTYVPEIKNISTSGAAHWLNKEKALIQLSLRGKRNDKFWFDFYHEAGHILLHGRKEQFIDDGEHLSSIDTDCFFTVERKLLETEADDFAANILIPKDLFIAFSSTREFTKNSVTKFAEKVQIAPGIVVGQLQNHGLLGWDKLNALKEIYNF